MPFGSAPPDPFKNPEAYIIWLHEEARRLHDAADVVGIGKLLDGQTETIEQLKREQAGE